MFSFRECWLIAYHLFLTPSPKELYMVTRHRKQRISKHSKNTTTT